MCTTSLRKQLVEIQAELRKKIEEINEAIVREGYDHTDCKMMFSVSPDGECMLVSYKVNPEATVLRLNWADIEKFRMAVMTIRREVVA